MADLEKTVVTNEYNAAEIQVLEGLEAVRLHLKGREDVS